MQSSPPSSNHFPTKQPQNTNPSDLNNNSFKIQKPKQCPYLSTIKKHLLDFDFEKICSITLSHNNIYACLVCGRYFQGRSPSSPAYQHSIQFSHYIYMNLTTSKIYCLPDDYQVNSYTIKDIQYNLKPQYTEQQFSKLQKMTEIQYNINGKQFIPGVMGMNNLGKTDYIHVIIYLFNSIKSIRRFFIFTTSFDQQILQQFSTLLKKLWNPYSFKGIINPHQFIQSIINKSQKKYKIGIQHDPLHFLLWFKNIIQQLLKKYHHIFNINQLFKGKLKLSFIKGIKNSQYYQSNPSKIQQTQFSTLKLQFPQKGVFNKTQSQILLSSIIDKYTAKIGQKYQQGLRYIKIIQFPQYLILHFKRFIDNGYTIQKDNSHLIYSSTLTIISDSTKTTYQLVGQICHTGDYLTGKYKIIIYMQQSNKWYQIQDLQVKQIIQKQAMLIQPYIQIYHLLKKIQVKDQLGQKGNI